MRPRVTAICAQRPSRLTASTGPNSPWRWSASASLDARSGRTFAVPGRCWKAAVPPNPAVHPSQSDRWSLLGGALARTHGRRTGARVQIAPDRPSVTGTPADKQFGNGASDTSKINFKGVHQTGSTPLSQCAPRGYSDGGARHFGFSALIAANSWASFTTSTSFSTHASEYV
jgi:hypothetical protein